MLNRLNCLQKTDAPPVAAAAGDKKENAETPSSSSGSETPDNVDDSDAPSQQELKSSLKRAEVSLSARAPLFPQAIHRIWNTFPS